MTATPEKKRFIAVIGGGECSPQEAKLAEEVGREIARSGAVLVCGGMGGVMEAACKGASEAGGLTIGILPGNTRFGANRYVQIPVVTGIGYARNSIVVRSAQAIIAVDGSYGTLTEIGYALQANIPLIGLGTWSISKNGEIDGHIIPADSPAEAVALAMNMITAQEDQEKNADNS